MDIVKERRLDINELCHDMMPQSVYGRFKVISTMVDKDNTVFGALEMILKMEPKSEKQRKKS